MEFYGLLGYPLGHSLSPLIHQLIAEELQLDTAYSLFEVEEEELFPALENLSLFNIQGVNVTFPYKQQVMPYLDAIDEKAERLQAVNTIKNDSAYLTGYNTDYEGVKRTVERQAWQLAGHEAVILGTGGASQAVSHCLHDLGAEVVLVSRQPQPDSDFLQISYDQLKDHPADLLVNATPVGMAPHPEESPVSSAVIDQFPRVFDLVYGSEKNKFLSYAEKLNKQYCDGLEMLVGQAIAAVEIWQDIKISDDLTDRIIHKLIESGWTNEK